MYEAKTIVNRFVDSAGVAKSAAASLIVELKSLLAQQSEVHLVLTGGTVGIATLAEVKANPDHKLIDFKRVHFWWGDERFLAAESVDRNALQARKALLNHLALDESKVHEFPEADGNLSLDEAARIFSREVQTIKPKFDIVLLGMGPDGHVASLFPNKPYTGTSMNISEAGFEWIIAEHDSPKPPAERLSFNYAALNSANEVWFVVSGADKQDAVAIAMGDNSESLPVGRVHGIKRTQWFVDSTAGTKVFGC